ncbi:efflux RND transporter periplasmic adaptor subunit [Lutispora thermophila]|uniref:HlyD family secretion protein n=1 Tax=Lutispora thermophila DSM 19022 TaxID=1122184 RepID=A0A1M6C2X6_9FIRM|nr:efflux RND transporter periplasmic adaptor subunit [Lutispora thermophila]SHI55058.1 HlyD family secretion protein [Lutispora thermophila DSM 19022]
MRGKKKFIWIGVILVIAVVMVYMYMTKNSVVDVEMAEVKRGNIDEYIEEKATVELKNKADIYAWQSGVVTFSSVDVGDEVKAGDVLLKIQDEDLKLQIRSMELQKQSIEAQLEEARKGLNQWDLQVLEAKVRTAQIAYDEAYRIMENNKKLYDAGGISKDTYESSVAALASAEANLEAAKAAMAAAQEGFSPNIEKQFVAKMDELKIQINHLRSKQKDYIIKSPIDGIVLVAEAPEGSIVSMGAMVFQIGRYDEMYLVSDILVDDMADVREGSQVFISNEDLDIRDVRGTVIKIHPQAFSKISDLGIEQKRIRIEISIDEEIDELRPGYDMDIKIITASSQNTLLIEEKAVFEQGGNNYIFINDDGTARLRQIEKGLESDDMIEVTKGLQEGEKVILSPNANIKEGTKIK